MCGLSRIFAESPHPHQLKSKQFPTLCDLQNLLGNCSCLNSCSLPSLLEFHPVCMCNLVFDRKLKRTSMQILELLLCVIIPLWYFALHIPLGSVAIILIFLAQLNETSVPFLDLSCLHHSLKSASRVGNEVKVTTGRILSTTLIVSVWILRKASSETVIQVQVVYLEADHSKYQQGCTKVKQGREGSL